MKRIIEKNIPRNGKRGVRRRAAAWLCALLMLLTALPTEVIAEAAAQPETIHAAEMETPAESARETYCGLEAHRHTPDCYDGDKLTCGLEEHTHGPACYEPDPVVTVRPVETVNALAEADYVSDESAGDAPIPALPREGGTEAELPQAHIAEAELPVEDDDAPTDEADAPAAEADAEIPVEAAEEAPGETDALIGETGVSTEETPNAPESPEIIENTEINENTEETEITEAPEIIEEPESKEEPEAPVEPEASAEEPQPEPAEEIIDEAPRSEEAEAELNGEMPIEEEEIEAAGEIPAEEEPEAEAPVTTYPAQAFEARAFNVGVSVRAPEGAFPADTAMEIRRVWDSDTLSDIRDSVEEDFVAVRRVTAVDITFRDPSGAEIEPLVPIEVSIAVNELREEQSAVVVHVDDDGDTQIVRQTAEAEDAGDATALTVEMPAGETPVAFEADSFSIYAVVVTETLQTRYIAADGETYNIKVTYGPEANIPAGASLRVEEQDAGDWLPLAEAALPEGERIGMARFFDIAIVSEGVEVEPAAPVEVSVALDTYAEGTPVAVHFADDGDAELIDADRQDEGVVFSAERFSVYGVVFTVDFEYNGYTHHLEGGGSMLLSELLAILNADVDVQDILDVTFTDPELLRVRPVEGGDWRLTSLVPFSTEETLTLTLPDGIVEIDVTDAAYSIAPDIADLLTKVVVYSADGETIGSSSGAIAKLRTDKSYLLSLSFAENSGHQFSNDNTEMFFKLPVGVKLTGFSNGTLDMELDDGIVLEGNTVRYDESTNTIYIKWNTSEKDKFELLTDSGVAEFTLKYQATFSKNLGEIEFNGTKILEVEPDDSYEVSVDKKGEYDRENDRVNYTVTVKAVGNATNIHVSDVITGTALTYDSTSFALNISGTDVSSPNVSHRADGFDLTIPALGNGKEALITYWATIDDYTKIHKLGTREDTLNTVTAKDSAGNPVTKESDLEGKIDYISVKKMEDGSGSYQKTENGMLIIPWTIVYNAAPKISVAGHTLTDTISSGAVDTMVYDTATPFTVEIYDKNNARVEPGLTYGDGWNGIDLQNFSYGISQEGEVTITGQSWTWTVPDESNYGKEGPYSYVIHYNTLVDPNHIMMKDASITNTVTDDETGSRDEATFHYPEGQESIPTIPDNKLLTVTKEAVEVTEKWTKWKVTIPRQSFDLIPAYLIDTHPKDGSDDEYVIVTEAEAREAGLNTNELTETSGRMVDITYGGREHVEEYVETIKGRGATVFRFALREVLTGEDGSVTYAPIDGTGILARNAQSEAITISFYTRNSDDWVRAASKGEKSLVHTNSVELRANGQSAKDDATVEIKLPGFEKHAVNLDTMEDGSKTLRPVATLAKDGAQLPVFKFVLTLHGVDGRDGSNAYYGKNWFNAENNLVVSDTYSSTMRMLTAEELTSLELGAYTLRPTDDSYQAIALAEPTVTSSDEGKMNAVFTISKDAFKRDESYVYAPVYELAYYLTFDLTPAQNMAQKALDEKRFSEEMANSAKLPNGPVTGATQIDFNVDLSPLDKSIAQIGSSEKYKYTLVINPLALTLNGGNAYRLTDSFTNLAVDFSTMKFTPAAAVTRWSYHGNEGNFWIADAAAVTIQYEAWPVGKRGSEFTMSNKAEMLDYIDTVERDVKLSSEHGGSARVYRLQLLKFADDNMKTRIGNVSFQLYDIDASGNLREMKYPYVEVPDLDAYGNYQVDDNQADHIKKKVLHNGTENIIFTTNENGIAKISLSMLRDGMTLESGKQYYLKEVEPPAGYNMEDIYWGFVISDVSDYTAYVYRTNDVLKVSNSSKKGALILRKEFEGEPLEYSKTKDIEFQIKGFKNDDDKPVFDRVVKYADFTKYFPASGEGYYCYRLTWDDDEIGELGIDYFTVSELAESAKFDGLVRTTKINGVVFDGNDDPNTTITVPDNTNEDAEVAFTNDYSGGLMSLTVSKAWAEGLTPAAGNKAVFKLYKNGEAYSTVTLPDGDNWTKTINNLPRCDAAGNAYTWSVEEIEAKLGTIHAENAEDVAERFVVTVSGDVSDTAQDTRHEIKQANTATVTFTNALNTTIPVKVVKKWAEDGTVTVNEIRFDLYRTTQNLASMDSTSLLGLSDKELVRSNVKLAKKSDGTWSEYTNDLMERYNSKGDPYHYFAIERPVAGYKASYAVTTDSTNKTQTITITNAKVNTGTLSVTKVVTGNSSMSGETFHFTVKNSEGKYLQTDGSLLDAEVKHEVKSGETVEFNAVEPGTYTVTEVDIPNAPSGYELITTIQVKAGDADATDNGRGTTAEAAVETGRNTAVTITNAYVEKTTDFTFGKLWNAPKQTRLRVWPKGQVIEVTIRRRADNADDETFKLVYTIGRDDDGNFYQLHDESAPDLAITDDEDYYRYQFKLSGLDRLAPNGSDWTYYAVETAVGSGFETHYGVVDGFSALTNDGTMDAHMGYNADIDRDIIGNIVNQLTGFKIDVPVQKAFSGYGRVYTVGDVDKFTFELTYTDASGVTRTKEVATDKDGLAVFMELHPMKLTNTRVQSAAGGYQVVGTVEYTIKEIEPEEKRLGVSYYNGAVTVKEELTIDWETQKIVSREKVIASEGNDKSVGSASIVTDGDDQYVRITNPYQEETWKLWVRKIWNDANNQDGLRKTLKFKINFYDSISDGNLLDTRSYDLNLSEETIKSIDVPKFINSEPVLRYEIIEDEDTLRGFGITIEDLNGTKIVVPGYTIEESKNTVITTSGYNGTATDLNGQNTSAVFTNKHTPQVMNIQVTKRWEDDCADASNRVSVPVTLYATIDGVKSAFNELKGDTDWAGYRNIEGQVTLTAQNLAAGSTDTWQYTWTGLPAFAPGRVGVRVYYSVEEDISGLPLGYYHKSTNGSTITNAYELTNISATKVWDDDGNRDGLREPITLRLSATSGVGGPDMLTALKNARYNVDDKTIGTIDKTDVSWDNLPKYDTDGTKIIYSVIEAEKPLGYELTIEGSAEKGFTLTNGHAYEKTRVTLTKTWVGDTADLSLRPAPTDFLDELELRMGSNVTLRRDPNRPMASENGLKYGLDTDYMGLPVSDTDAIRAAWVEIVASGNVYEVVYGNLPMYKRPGSKISYTLTEKTVKGYSPSAEGGTVALSANNIGTLTNTRNTANLKISKALVSDRAADTDEVFNFTVTASCAITASYPLKDSQETVAFNNGVAHLTLKGGQTATLLGLPTEITYTVTEAADERFTTHCNGGETNTFSAVLDKNAEAAFTNTRKTGDLVIAKVVDSPVASDPTHEFKFRVTLDDETITKTYSSVTFTRGMSDVIVLRHGESRRIEGLPTDVGYTVEEITDQDEAYFADFAAVAPVTGTIQPGTNDVTITNTRKFVPVSLMKVDALDNAKALAGAEFTLSRGDVSVTLVSDETGALLAQTDVESDAIVAAEGSSLMRLADGTYDLTETNAPEGYRKLIGEVTLTVENFQVILNIPNQGERLTVPGITQLDADNTVVGVQVPDIPGSDFPATGGPGVNALYAAGCALLALWMMARRRRA